MRGLVLLGLVIACGGEKQTAREDGRQPPSADARAAASRPPSPVIDAQPVVPDGAVLVEHPPGTAYPQVFRVVLAAQDPDWDTPWQLSPGSATASAVVIAPGVLLTAAHAVQHAVPADALHPGPHQRVARIRTVSDDCDLALLEVDGLETTPAALGPLPAPGTQVTAAGYPDGYGLKVATGAFRGLEVQRYSNSQRHLLAGALAVRVSPGDSGGPVFDQGKVIGILAQRLRDDPKRTEMVPAPMIAAFLDGARRHARPEVPALGVDTQLLDNLALRRWSGASGGVLVLRVDPDGSADRVLVPHDVITAIDGSPIQADGTIEYLGAHLAFDATIGLHHIGDTVRLDIVRSGRNLAVELVLAPWRPLVSRGTEGRVDYIVYGGLLFERLTRGYLTTWDEWWNKAPKELLNFYYIGVRTPERHDVIVLTRIFDDPLNAGYAGFYNESVATVNGKHPLDFAEFVHLLSEAKGAIQIETGPGDLIVLDADEVRAATPRILQRYSITVDRTPDR